MVHRETIVILNDIRSSENVGSIMRTADAAGVSKVYFTGYTPAPKDRFDRENTRLHKAALGAEKFVAWEKRDDIFSLIAELKRHDVRVTAVEQAVEATPLSAFAPGNSVAYIFGNEVEGLRQEILNVADEIVEIPMHGEKESLNVAVAAGIILFNTRSNR